MDENSRRGTLVRAIQTCIDPDDQALAELADIFTDDATVWSPNMLAVGLADLTDNLLIRNLAFTDVTLQITSVGVLGNKGFAEFEVAATFTGPFVLGGDAAIEPNGDRLMIGAAAVADFAGDKIKALRGYFDDATLFEQMLAEPA